MSDKVQFTLDGQTVEAEAGMTIWEVANDRGLVTVSYTHLTLPTKA